MKNYLDYRFDKHTNTGNDGIIQKIFETLEIENGSFVEFGAWDGVFASNCRKLFEEGWGGLFIEGNDKRFADLEKNYSDHHNVECAHSMVGLEENKLEDIMLEHLGSEALIDFCSIDIDGLDLEIFEAIG